MERADHDDDLVRALRGERPDAPAMLGDRHGARIFGLASMILGDPRDAEEVTKDVLLTIVREIGTFRGIAAFSSWIYRITATEAFARFRKRRRGSSEAALGLHLFPGFDAAGEHTELVSEWSGELDNAAIAGELRRAIARGLEQLPVDYRAIIALRDMENLPSEEVAGILGMTIPAVRSHVHRGRLFLCQRLGWVLSRSTERPMRERTGISKVGR